MQSKLDNFFMSQEKVIISRKVQGDVQERHSFKKFSKKKLLEPNAIVSRLVSRKCLSLKKYAIAKHDIFDIYRKCNL